MKTTRFGLVALTIFSVCLIPKAEAQFTPSDVNGLQVWLDSSQPDSFYADIAKTAAATMSSSSVAVWADKSGNGNDAIAISTTARPKLGLNVEGGNPALYFNGTMNFMSLGNPDSINFSTASTSSFFFVYKTKISGQQAILGRSVGGDSNGLYGIGISSPRVPGRGVFGGYSGINPYTLNTPNLFSYSTETFNNSPYYSSYNPFSTVKPVLSEVSYSNSTIPYVRYGDAPTSAQGANPWLVGTISGTFNGNFNGYLEAILVYNRKLSESEMASVNSYLTSKFNIPVVSANPAAQIVYDGNSIVYGIGASVATSSFANIVYNLQSDSAKYRFTNMGIGGKNTTAMNVDAATRIDPLYSESYGKNILVGFEGSNDLGATTSSGAYANLVKYYSDRKNAGWKVIAATVLPRTGFETQRQAVNTPLRANFKQYADALVDLGNDPTIGQSGQNVMPYYGDGVHPTDLGYSIIAPQMKIAIDAVVNPLTTLSNVATSNISTSSVTVSWDTDASASSIVEFDTNSSILASSTPEIDTAIRVTSHSVNLTGLNACTQYYFRTHSRQLDPNGEVRLANNDATSTIQSFVTTGCGGNHGTTPPAITNINVVTTSTTATITWTSSVCYSGTSSECSASTSPVVPTSHSMILRSLTPSTTYQFQLAATDTYNSSTNSTEVTFVTAAS